MYSSNEKGNVSQLNDYMVQLGLPTVFRGGHLDGFCNRRQYNSYLKRNNDAGGHFQQSGSGVQFVPPAPKFTSQYYNLTPDYQDTNPNKRKKTKDEGFVSSMRKFYGNRYCENCNRGFYDLEQYEIHLKNHKKCVYPECDFEGNITALDGHLSCHIFVNQDTSDFVAKRRKNYPRQETCALKAAQEKQRRKRGELIGLRNKRHPYLKNNNSSKFSSRQSLNKKSVVNRKKKVVSSDKSGKPLCERNLIDKEEVMADEKEEPLIPFAGIGPTGDEDSEDSDSVSSDEELNQECNFLISDEEDFENQQISNDQNISLNDNHSKVSLLEGVIGSLVEYYGSDSEESTIDSGENSGPIVNKLGNIVDPYKSSDNIASKPRVRRGKRSSKKNVKEAGIHETSSTCENKRAKQTTDLDVNEDQKIVSIKPLLATANDGVGGLNMTQIKEQEQAQACLLHKRKILNMKVKDKLLKKFFEKSVSHERNVLLQCCRYVVTNNFFEQS